MIGKARIPINMLISNQQAKPAKSRLLNVSNFFQVIVFTSSKLSNK